MSKIYALIPARSGSKQVPDKNILLLDNIPLIAYSIAAAKLCPLIDEVIVSTDSHIYQSIAKKFGAKAPFLRPDEISTDTSLDIEFFHHFISWCKEAKFTLPEYIIHLRPSTPLRDPKIIIEAIRTIKASRDATALRSCEKTNLTPYKLFYEENLFMKPYLKDCRFKESYNQPRQIFPATFVPNGYVDIIKTSTFLNCDVLHGENILLFETQPTIDIDSKEDFLNAKFELKNSKYCSLKDYLKEF